MKRRIRLMQSNLSHAGFAFSGLIFILSAPLVISEFYLNLVVLMMIRGLLALSFNLLYGFTGRLAFGHASLLGVGAYGVGVLLTRSQVPYPAALAIAIVVTSAVAAIIGYFCLRFLTYYFSLLTLAFGQLLFLVTDKWYALTGGDDGLHGIVAPYPLSETTGHYYYVLFLTAISVALMWWIVNSPFGSTLRAIRDNRVRAEFIGVNVRRQEWIAFVIAGSFAGLAGALFATFNQSISPYLLNWTRSAEPVIMTILGGPYLFWGPLLGSVIFTGLESLVTDLIFDLWPMVLGTILIVMVLVFPDGIGGFLLAKSSSKEHP